MPRSQGRKVELSHARNADEVERAHAVLSLAEYSVRTDVTPQDCSDGDLLFMNESSEILCKDLDVLRLQAQAQSTDAWRAVLDSAHSMRGVVINRDRKEYQRQRMFRCDGCGKNETWCGLAIDLAGAPGLRRPASWLSNQPMLIGGDGAPSERWPSLFEEFQNVYEKTTTNPANCDMGRFYLGKTCHRKAHLCFVANTMVQETIYNANEVLKEKWNADPKNFLEDELYSFDDDAPTEFLERKKQLELCIADDKLRCMPDLLIDAGFWDRVDKLRSELTDDEIRQKATNTLQKASDVSDEQCPAHAATAPKKRSRVIIDDDDDDDDEDPTCAMHPVAHTALEKRSTPPSAVAVTRNMRIPCEGGAPLPSRQAALLGLLNVQKDLIVKRETGLAAQVGAAVLTMQELLEMVERG